MGRHKMRLAAVLLAVIGLAGCIYQPAPYYAYPAPAYGPPVVYGPPVFYGPPVVGSLSVGIGGGFRHWR